MSTSTDGDTASTRTPPRTAFTPREVATSLGIPYRAVLALIAENRIRHTRIGAQRYVIPAGAVEEFLGEPAA